MVILAEMFAKEKNIITYGQELYNGDKKCCNSSCNNDCDNNCNKSKIQVAKSLKDASKNANIIIAPIPFSKDGIVINAPFTKEQILIEQLINYSEKKLLISGAVSTKICDIAKKHNVNIIDIMKIESLAIFNTIATAEGTIEIAMEKTPKVIHGSNVLVLGFGKVAKIVAQKFKALSSNVTIAARKEADFALAQAYGYNYTDINLLENNLQNFDIIINTVPVIILNKEKLEKVKRDALIIDLASKPGGVDYNAAKKLNINFEWALGLPGKVAPATTALYIKNTIDKILNTEEKQWIQ